MSSVIISGDTSGAITLSSPAVAGTNTATLPAATGTVMVSGNMPAFSAYASAGQSIASATVTKVIANTKEFDTNTNYDATTNYRFTPTIAGYYQINIGGWWSLSAANSYIIHYIYKNGSAFKQAVSSTNLAGYGGVYLSTVLYLNGSTDYVEYYVIQYTGSAGTLLGSQASTIFSGSLVRTA